MGKVFIDANIINFAAVYEKNDILDWINRLYEEVYIHISVLNELLLKTVRDKAQKMIDDKIWVLFDPDNPECLSEDSFVIYERFANAIKNGFQRLEMKKKLEGREVKNTSNFGEIESLAAAMVISANFICSNDFDIREVIQDEKLFVSPNEEDTPQLIKQDTVEDICFLSVQQSISSRKEVRQFFKFVYNQDPEQKRQRKLNKLNERLDKLP